MVEYERRLSGWMQNGTDTGTLDLSCCCLLKSFKSYHHVQTAGNYERELDLEASENERSRILCWRAQPRVFSVPLAKCFLLYVHVPVYWNVIETLRQLRVPSSPCSAYYSGVLFGVYDFNTKQVQHTVALMFVVWTLGAFLLAVCHSTLTRYDEGSIWQACDERSTLVSLNQAIWTPLG